MMVPVSSCMMVSVRKVLHMVPVRCCMMVSVRNVLHDGVC